MAEALQELSEAVEEVALRARPSVVGVGASGSGIVLEEGLVATNAHNLRGEEVLVSFADGSRRGATVAGVDVEGDLAVLSVETSGATPLSWATTPVRPGQLVVAAADPGGRELRVSVGFVASVNVGFSGPTGRRVAGAFEHSAPLRRGSSGGPALDATGQLLGINTSRQGDGFYRAIAVDGELRSRLEGLARGERPEHPRLGVALAPSEVARRLRAAVGLPARDGLLVRAVERGGAGERAGIREGDLIVAIGGQPATTIDALAAGLARVPPRGSAVVGLLRGSDELSITVDFAPGEPTE